MDDFSKSRKLNKVVSSCLKKTNLNSKRIDLKRFTLHLY